MNDRGAGFNAVGGRQRGSRNRFFSDNEPIVVFAGAVFFIIGDGCRIFTYANGMRKYRK